MIDPWVQLIVQLGALGIVAFGAHYVLTKTIPGMLVLFTSELKEQRTLHTAELKSQREAHNSTEIFNQSAFLRTLTEQRTDFRAAIDANNKTEDEMAKRIHELTVAVVGNTCPHLKGANTPQSPR